MMNEVESFLLGIVVKPAGDYQAHISLKNWIEEREREFSPLAAMFRPYWSFLIH